jgi:hypothetical protein
VYLLKMTAPDDQTVFSRANLMFRFDIGFMWNVAYAYVIFNGN